MIQFMLSLLLIHLKLSFFENRVRNNSFCLNDEAVEFFRPNRITSLRVFLNFRFPLSLQSAFDVHYLPGMNMGRQ